MTTTAYKDTNFITNYFSVNERVKNDVIWVAMMIEEGEMTYERTFPITLHILKYAHFTRLITDEEYLTRCRSACYGT